MFPIAIAVAVFSAVFVVGIALTAVLPLLVAAPLTFVIGCGLGFIATEVSR